MLDAIVCHHEALFAEDHGAIRVQVLERVADGLHVPDELRHEPVEERVGQKAVALFPPAVGVDEAQRKLPVAVRGIPDSGAWLHRGEQGRNEIRGAWARLRWQPRAQPVVLHVADHVGDARCDGQRRVAPRPRRLTARGIEARINEHRRWRDVIAEIGLPRRVGLGDVANALKIHLIYGAGRRRLRCLKREADALGSFAAERLRVG